MILKQAREHNVRLVLLWFGTWKNGSPHYMPFWTKSNTNLYTHIMGNRGRTVDSPSPLAEAAMHADMKAFSALMRHLKSADPMHTVIMVQVENEPGAWGSIRDYSPEAEKAMAAPVPAEFLQALGGRNGAGTNSGNWRAVFGDNADEYFHAYCVAHYINQVAAAGKAEYPLPMYVNVALRDPLSNPRAGNYESGGATDNVLDIWKAAAPAIDILAPDIYQNDSAKYLAVLDHYSRPDNALFVPETGGTGNASRMCFAALGHGAIGWSPFGLDYTRTTPESLAPVGMNYRMLEPIMREVARLNFEGKVKAVEEEAGQTTATLNFGEWSAIINFTVAGGGRGGRGGQELRRQQIQPRRTRRRSEKMLCRHRPRRRAAHWLPKSAKINSSSPAALARLSFSRRPERIATFSALKRQRQWNGQPALPSEPELIQPLQSSG